MTLHRYILHVLNLAYTYLKFKTKYTLAARRGSRCKDPALRRISEWRVPFHEMHVYLYIKLEQIYIINAELWIPSDETTVVSMVRLPVS
jgi:hypothetical protein